jgi:hypothetical protein
MVEFRTRKGVITGFDGNHHEKPELIRISCGCRLTIPDTAGTSPDPECNYTDMRFSQPNQVSRTQDFSYPLVFSISFSSSSHISLFLVHNSTIIAEHNVKSSLSTSPCHDHELTPSNAYTEHCIHRALHTASTASSQDCLSSLHSDNCELTPECSFSFRRASPQDRSPPDSSPCELKSNVILSCSHGCELTN